MLATHFIVCITTKISKTSNLYHNNNKHTEKYQNYVQNEKRGTNWKAKKKKKEKIKKEYQPTFVPYGEKLVFENFT